MLGQDLTDTMSGHGNFRFEGDIFCGADRLCHDSTETISDLNAHTEVKSVNKKISAGREGLKRSKKSVE